MHDLGNNTVNNKHSYLLEYYNKIKSGEIVAGRELIMELENLIADLDNPAFIYETSEANFRIMFIEKFCKHTKSPFFGKPFKLELFQKALIEATYSFKWTDEGYESYYQEKPSRKNSRRFKKVVLLIGRKNGKTTLCAGLSNGEFFCGNGGADIVCSSNDDAQASIIFDEINSMREWSPVLKKRSHKNMKGIFNLKNKSTVKKLSERTKNKEGRNIDFAILDEVHEMKTNIIGKSIEQSQSTKDEPLLIMITTEGFVNDGYLDKELKYARKVIDGDLEDLTLLSWLYTQDSESEIWQDKKTWNKSNPGLGVIKKNAYLSDQVKKAQQDKSERVFTLAKDFNFKQNNAAAWLMPEDIANEEVFYIEEFRNCLGIGAVDLSKTGDLASARIMFMKPGSQKKYFIQKYFIPESKLKDLRKVDEEKFKEWIRQDLICISEGNENDFRNVTAWFVNLFKNYGIKFYKIGYDKWSAVYWEKEMESYGFDCVKVSQEYGAMSEPMKLVEKDLKSKLINYNNNPIDKYCLENTALSINSKLEIMPIKIEGQEYRKIDGAVTMIIAYKTYIDNRTEFLELIRR